MHSRWVGGDRTTFDLIVVAYEELPSELTGAATEHLLLPGSKVAGWSRLFAERPDLLDRYDALALMDDDLVCSAADINACFAMGRHYGLSLWQPSLSWDSYFSYAVFLSNPLFRLRFVNFIEMMCPFFSAEHLKRSLPLFDLGFETGIDRWWCRLQGGAARSYAVLDDIRVLHSRPVGTNKGDQGFVGVDSEYQIVIDKMEARAGLYFRGPVAYAGISRSGHEIAGRVPMAARALMPIQAYRTKVNSGWFYRPIFDHVRHILTRPIDNEPVDLATLRHRLQQSDGVPVSLS